MLISTCYLIVMVVYGSLVFVLCGIEGLFLHLTLAHFVERFGEVCTSVKACVMASAQHAQARKVHERHQGRRDWQLMPALCFPVSQLSGTSRIPNLSADRRRDYQAPLARSAEACRVSRSQSPSANATRIIWKTPVSQQHVLGIQYRSCSMPVAPQDLATKRNPAAGQVQAQERVETVVLPCLKRNILMSIKPDGWRSPSASLYLVYGLVVFYALCYQLQAPLEPFLVERLVGKDNASEASVSYGRLQSLFSGIQMFASLLFGHILDKAGVRVGFILNFVACAATYFLLSITDSMAMLYASKIPGIGMAGFLCAQTAVSELTAAGPERVQALGRLTTAYTLGGIVGPYCGGLLGAKGDYFPERETCNARLHLSSSRMHLATQQCQKDSRQERGRQGGQNKRIRAAILGLTDLHCSQGSWLLEHGEAHHFNLEFHGLCHSKPGVEERTEIC